MTASIDGLRDKTIAIIGVGGRQKIRHYVALKQWGIRVVAVCSEMDLTPSERYAHDVILIERLYDHQHDDVHLTQLIDALAQRPVQLDGVLTLWEDCGPLTAQVARALGLPGVDPDSASVAKSKLNTYQALAESRRGADHARLDVVTRPCNSLPDLDRAVADVGLPAILKLEYGSSAAAVVPVHSHEEARETWQKIKRTLKTERDWPGIGLGYGSRIVLAELLQGTEHDVDIVLWRGEAVASFVTDNGPTRAFSCAESSAVMPSVASPDKQTILCEAALAACLRLGLTSGVFNIELIHTSDGPRVIDVNGRMGGFYIRDWILTVWKYDLLNAAVCCCIGIPPRQHVAAPSHCIAGAMLLPSVHGRWLSDSANVERLRSAASRAGNILIEFEDDVHTHELVDEPWGNLAVGRAVSAEAVATLLRLWRQLSLTKTDPELERILSSLMNTPQP